jgi:tetraacyldisaccharide 4'-kinase
MRARIEQALHAAWQRRGPLSLLLRPLSFVYGAVVASRSAGYRYRPRRVHHDSVPVVVVGNIYVGGTGKTPVVIALIRALQEKGWHPGLVSRGYGAARSDKPRTGRGTLDPALFGDEPALVAAETGAPVSVHPDRQAAIRRLRRQFPDVDVVVSDDGLQHLAMGRDLEIIVQDARGTGNGLLLPAGPLREPPERLQSADVIVNNLLPGESAPVAATGLAHVVNMTMEPVAVEHLASGERTQWNDWLAAHGQQPCAAAAAIGRPERFFSMLTSHGAPLVQTLALPDHHDYRDFPFDRIDAGCILITPKDAIKCRRLNDGRLYCVHPGPRFSDPAWLDLVHDMLRAIYMR